MSRWWSRLGLAVVAVVLAVGAAGCLPGGEDTDVVAEFSRGFNLFPGSDVRVLGLTVGRVVEVTVEEGRGTVRARLDLDDEITLPAGVNAHVVQGALLGERFVELEPAHTGGPALAPGEVIPLERTTVPAEFDELLESLDRALDGLPPDELARLVRNAAGVLEGRGEQLGSTLEHVGGAISALRAADDDLVGLIAQLADLNETLATRDTAIGGVIEDYAGLIATLGDERETIDGTLSAVAGMVSELRRVSETHAGRLDETVEAVTRVGRTSTRNLDEIDRLLFGQSELYRHAERVMDFERNWLPLVNHDQDLGRMFQDRLAERLAGLCERLELPSCTTPTYWDDQLPAEVCLPGIVTCRETEPDGAPVDEATLEEALGAALERVPALVEAVSAPATTPSGPAPATLPRRLARNLR